jgi:hypothetical protein
MSEGREDGFRGPLSRVSGNYILWCWMDMHRNEFFGAA